MNHGKGSGVANTLCSTGDLGKYLGAKAIKANINADLPLGKSLGRKG